MKNLGTFLLLALSVTHATFASEKNYTKFVSDNDGVTQVKIEVEGCEAKLTTADGRTTYHSLRDIATAKKLADRDLERGGEIAVDVSKKATIVTGFASALLLSASATGLTKLCPLPVVILGGAAATAGTGVGSLALLTRTLKAQPLKARKCVNKVRGVCAAGSEKIVYVEDIKSVDSEVETLRNYLRRIKSDAEYRDEETQRISQEWSETNSHAIPFPQD